MGNKQHDEVKSHRRRGVLCGLCAIGLHVPAFSRGSESGLSEQALAPPREDDLLVFAFGDRAGETIDPGDLKTGDPQIFAYAMDPASGVIRNGTRLNQVIVVKLELAGLSWETAARAADGMVAYSGVCTHTGCDVTDWNAEQRRFQCPCHESQFDPGNGARVVGGPAPRQLAALPLKLNGGILAVAGEFSGRVGFDQPGLNPFGL